MKKQKRKPRPAKARKRKPPAKAPPSRPVPPGAAAPAAPAPPGPQAELTAARVALASGEWAAALSAGRRALMAQPDDPEILNATGVAAFHLGDPSEAQSLFETALAFDSGHAEARNNLGNLLRETGRLDDAEAAYRAVLARHPQHVDAGFNLGVLFEVAGRFADAEQAFNKVLALAPDHADARFHVGNIMKALNRLDEAVAAYDAVLRTRPGHADAATNKGAVLQELGKPVEALAAYGQALEIAPRHPAARYNRATLYQETGRPEAALAEYDILLATHPDHAGAQVNKAYALREMGRLDDALAASRAAIALAPDYDKAQVNLADLYLEMGDADKAASHAADYLRDHPGNTAMLAFQAIALNEIGDTARRDRLLDYDRLLRPQKIDPPAGYDTIAVFNRDLARHLRSHPSLIFSPASHATRHGRHSGELLVEPKGPVAALETTIHAAVDDYLATLSPEAETAFLARRGPKTRLSVWGVVMEDQGHQLPHIHPAAWLSGVYYPEIPELVRADDPDHQGWIEFGRAPGDFHAKAPAKVTLIRPAEGLMILFPSYLYHRTVPFHAPVERLSFAFDLLAGD